jgi:protein SCO1
MNNGDEIMRCEGIQERGVIARQFMLKVMIIFAAVFSPCLVKAESLAETVKTVEATHFNRYVAEYKLPDVSVLRQDGQKLAFLKALDDGRPVILNFVFISCSAICPMMSHIFSKVQDKLTKEGQPFHLVTISIDPESDTPAMLTEYGKKFSAGPNWSFYTGSRAVSLALQKAFKAYRGDKMNHAALIFLRPQPGKPWVRLEGFVSPDVVVDEYKSLLHPN